MPLVIEKYGFRKAIEELADTVNLSGKIKLETVVVGFDDTRKYNSTYLNDLYRIIQELLHNIIKHAKASQASLEMVEHENHISIMVEDNGIGIAEDMAGKGKGLTTIQSRIAYLNGKMEIARKQENGTLIVIEIPV
jgi:signal transduction histidine kinase